MQPVGGKEVKIYSVPDGRMQILVEDIGMNSYFGPIVKEEGKMKRLCTGIVVVIFAVIFFVDWALAGQVMTVRGPISPDKMGVTLVHEHITFAYPGWYADESVDPYDRKAIEAKCLKTLKELKALGVRTIIDPSMADTGGRDPILLRNLSKKTGINIVVATGLYFEKEGAPLYFKRLQRMGRNLEDDVYELFVKEITVGIGKTGIKAGVIKVATDDPVISDYEQAIMRAAVRAAQKTGVPIMTHCQGATVGPVQQDLFLTLGANPKKIVIGHQNNSTDINYHLTQLKKPDFFIAFDRTSLGSDKADDCLIELVQQGYADRLMVSHDAILVWLGRPFTVPDNLKERYGKWNPNYTHKVLIPKMKAAGITDEQIKTILVDNPRRLFE